MENSFEYKPVLITAEYYEQAVGTPPIQDDLERSNCPKAGQLGHRDCGWNFDKNGPVFMYGQDKITQNLSSELGSLDAISIINSSHSDNDFTVVVPKDRQAGASSIFTMVVLKERSACMPSALGAPYKKGQWSLIPFDKVDGDFVYE